MGVGGEDWGGLVNIGVRWQLSHDIIAQRRECRDPNP